MPLFRSGSDMVSIYDGAVASLPPNLLGDHCDANQDYLCGYWYNDGWNDADLQVYPDPEDWRAENNHGQSYVSCMFR